MPKRKPSTDKDYKEEGNLGEIPTYIFKEYKNMRPKDKKIDVKVSSLWLELKQHTAQVKKALTQKSLRQSVQPEDKKARVEYNKEEKESVEHEEYQKLLKELESDIARLPLITDSLHSFGIPPSCSIFSKKNLTLEKNEDEELQKLLGTDYVGTDEFKMLIDQEYEKNKGITNTVKS